MYYRVHHFESSQNGNGNECLLISLIVRKFPSNKDSQCDEQDQTTENVSDDRKWM